MASDPKKDITTGILVSITAVVAVGSIVENGQNIVLKGLLALAAAAFATRWLVRGFLGLRAERRRAASPHRSDDE
jgi:hypothetical protein